MVKIRDGFMAGTVKQDGTGMAETIGMMALNNKEGLSMTKGLENKVTDGWRINIPYSIYTASNDE